MKMTTTINSLSGGRTSSYMAIHYPADINIFACVCIDYPQATPRDREILNYSLNKLDGNFIASAESVKTLKIMMDLEQFLGKEIVWVRGKSFDQIIDKARCLPTWARRFCTTELKILPIFEWVYFRHGFVKENIGFRFDELHRAYKSIKKETIHELIDLFGDLDKIKNYIKQKTRNTKSTIKDYPISQNLFGKKQHNLTEIYWANKQYPLIDHKIDHKIILDFWKKNKKFEFPTNSNCVGCHHKSPSQIKNNYFENPEIIDWFILQEKKGKFNTWHDDKIPYEEKIKMEFTQLLELNTTGSCDTSYCVD